MHPHYWARWNGSSWDTETVATTGTGLDDDLAEGGIALMSPYRALVSRYVSGAWQMYLYRRGSGGWSEIGKLTTDSGPDFRPVVVRDRPSLALWQHGTVTGNTAIATGVRAYETQVSALAGAASSWPSLKP